MVKTPRIFEILQKARYLAHRQILRTMPLGRRFDAIYRNNRWYGNGESRSGSGSTLNSTLSIREELPKRWESYGIRSLIDIGCGDFNWQRQMALPQSYLGVDIAADVIETNTTLYESEHVSFAELNAVSEHLPPGFDAAIIREVLFHLSFRDALSLCENVQTAGVKYVLATNSTKVSQNFDIVSGEFRNLNLELPPFSWPEPLDYIADDAVSEGRSLGIWSTESLKRS